MTITNRFNLPQTIVNSVSRHVHKAGNYSASMLANSPRQVWLQRRHDDEITEDVSDRIWSLLGTAVHYILEHGEGAQDLTEQYMQQEILPSITVSGTSDLYSGDDRRIRDYKTTSVWTIIYNSRADEWAKQLNTYAWLFGKTGFRIDGLQIVAILRDWSRTKAKQDPSYPQSQVAVIDIPLWAEDLQFAYIKGRVELFESHKETPDVDLPFCTDKERWKNGDKYAVMKDGRKTAVRVLDDLNEAENMAASLGSNHHVIARSGEAKRCADYCPAAAFCNQYQAELAEHSEEDAA